MFKGGEGRGNLWHGRWWEGENVSLSFLLHVSSSQPVPPWLSWVEYLMSLSLSLHANVIHIHPASRAGPALTSPLCPPLEIQLCPPCLPPAGPAILTVEKEEVGAVTRRGERKREAKQEGEEVYLTFQQHPHQPHLIHSVCWRPPFPPVCVFPSL